MQSDTPVQTSAASPVAEAATEKRSQPARTRQRRASRKINVGPDERVISVVSGAILAALGLSRRSWAGLAVAGVGGALAYRGVSGHCHAYEALGVNTAKGRAVHVERAYLILRSPEDLYAFWRNFYNVPRIMPYLERVDIIDEKRSHWVGRGLLNATFEWDAEITKDEPGRAIAWRSLPGGDLSTAGEIQFTPAPADRGTEARIKLNYVPPAGKLGQWIATLLGRSPERLLRDELQNFKRIMETGEIPTTIGQPHGTCTGRGARYTEKGLTGTRR